MFRDTVLSPVHKQVLALMATWEQVPGACLGLGEALEMLETSSQHFINDSYRAKPFMPLSRCQLQVFCTAG